MTKLKRTLALVLAGSALAIGVPAALAAGGGGDDAAGTQPAGPAVIQDENQQSRPDRGPGDCPEKDGGDQGSGSGSSSSDSGGATEL